MARIVKLTELLPEDIHLEMPDGNVHILPGDPPLKLILRLAELFERTQNDSDDNEIGLEIIGAIDDELLRLLRMRNPSLDESPFGILGAQHVVAEILKAYNFGVEGEGEQTEDPPKRKPAARKR